jgi:hypothetical protein
VSGDFNGDGTFQTAVSYPGPAATAIALADVNGDGYVDVVTANLSSGTISIYLGQGNGTFLPPASFLQSEAPIRAIVTDLNGDGRPDIVTSSLNGFVSVRLGSGFRAGSDRNANPHRQFRAGTIRRVLFRYRFECWNGSDLGVRFSDGNTSPWLGRDRHERDRVDVYARIALLRSQR